MPSKRSELSKALAAARRFERQVESAGRHVVKVGKATMKAMKVHETERHVRYRIRDPRAFDPRSFRVLDPGRPGKTKMIIGCPRGFFRAGRCKVGTVVQAVLKEK